ncbi:putative winged helix-turn-helix DNA-binding domain, CDT1 Geminin-binding domain-containing protein [Medicago truncatula]|uniref:Putative winged helix-turn-helix DNA-binding domain, CDT1 Geminin-binding domain-containing protein n=1 Tax=Medicago truncatula TaxID=3880 RepID=A0A396HMX4_MEDTR|nr:putative winged helix-turn-helix DNA-binding domain, CDT1 Geminin-binding domain-containing protein [Medicago truncatula]
MVYDIRKESGVKKRSIKCNSFKVKLNIIFFFCEYFDAIHSSIKLLKLRGFITSFSKIKPKVEIICGRAFTLRVLAQLVYILPERIIVNKIQLLDEHGCSRSELEVSITTPAYEDGLDDLKFRRVRNLFC